jgi:DNA helicase II / ATP-dependent DNA helicase PcrA
MRLDDLNPPQRAAVTLPRGPLLVLAGAGTGKTRVITYRIARLIQQGTSPERILAVTFTNKAAREMKERAMALLRGSAKRHTGPTPEISTFHSLCVRILRRNAALLGYPERFSIFDRGDQETLARHALREIRVGNETLRPAELLHFLGNWKNAGVSPDAAERLATSGPVSDVPLLAALAYRKYQAQLKATGAVDFDDLLLLTDELLGTHPTVRRAEAERFDHVLVDEYQDTNALQYRITRHLAAGHRNLCVVGDDDQSIYGWRGAQITHILHFADDWPEARIVRLEDNYRCQAPILELANTLISRNRSRHEKTLRPARLGGEAPRFMRCEEELAEAQSVGAEIRRLLDDNLVQPRVRPSEIAILFRTNEQARVFETELRKLRVPYVIVGGTSFYDRREVKDILSYLRVFANPSDEVSLLRIINCPPRGIGPASVEPLLREAVSRGEPLWSVLCDRIRRPSSVMPSPERLAIFVGLIERFRLRAAGESLPELIRALILEIGYKAEIERLYKTPRDIEARNAAVEEIVNAAAHYQTQAESPTLIGFLDECALVGRDDLADNDGPEQGKNAVTLMTLHSAKGLEFPHVFLVGMEEGMLPHRRSVLEGGSAGIEEERRLCYVGITRARDTLTLSYAKGRMKWGKLQPSIPSRFLLEMRGDEKRAQKVAEMARALFGHDPIADAQAADATNPEGADDQLLPRRDSPPMPDPSPKAGHQSSRRNSASSRSSRASRSDATGSARDAAALPRRQRKSKAAKPQPTSPRPTQPSKAALSRGTRSGTARKRGP